MHMNHWTTEESLVQIIVRTLYTVAEYWLNDQTCIQLDFTHGVEMSEHCTY